ncbi:hypothetical protein COLO4_28051 [Corchorus olitorius]|uniref:Uncharacterized protein n=1 Tax=Corchorus olitorius TaxID=93759 RepID=A0A1R3HN84_9ROSI|nr:hypothetical protein COLO4_28051 [Corchorus olitorius]
MRLSSQFLFKGSVGTEETERRGVSKEGRKKRRGRRVVGSHRRARRPARERSFLSLCFGIL